MSAGQQPTDRISQFYPNLTKSINLTPGNQLCLEENKPLNFIWEKTRLTFVGWLRKTELLGSSSFIIKNVPDFIRKTAFFPFRFWWGKATEDDNNNNWQGYVLVLIFSAAAWYLNWYFCDNGERKYSNKSIEFRMLVNAFQKGSEIF